jgi:hypothetical protein
VALLTVAQAGAAQARAASAPSPGAAVLAQLRTVTSNIDSLSHVASSDFNTDSAVIPIDCGEVRLTRMDSPDKHAEAQAVLARAVRLARETLTRDFQPAVQGPGSDYARLADRIEALSRATSGPRRALLVHAVIELDRARHERLEELQSMQALLTQLAGGDDCTTSAKGNKAFAFQGAAETSEKEAIDSLAHAGNFATSKLNANRPMQFAVTAQLTTTVSHNEQLTTDGQCGEKGGEAGTATESAQLGRITVNGRGQIFAAQLTAPATVTGSWTDSGVYYQEGQCQFPTTYTCNGGFAPLSTGSSSATMEIAHVPGLEASMFVELPEIAETGTDGCPLGDDVMDYVVEPAFVHDLAVHADTFGVPIDGMALRQRFDTTTIETGIEHEGPPLPAADCNDGSGMLASCSNAGSSVHVVVTIKPVAE